MYHESSEEQLRLLAQSARDFAKNFIAPHIMKWDETQIFPIDLFRQLGKQGFMGIMVPEQYGGSGLSYQEYVSILDEISKVCGSIGLSVAAHNSLCSNHILSFGNEQQKEKYLHELASGEWLSTMGS